MNGPNDENKNLFSFKYREETGFDGKGQVNMI
jgi:hypothetical protein